MRESTIERYLCTRIKHRGGYAIKLLGVIGIPDRLVLLPGARVVFVELKAPKGVLSPLQKRWGRIITGLGLPYFVLKSREEVDEFILHCGV